jgi:hypothetical protein
MHLIFPTIIVTTQQGHKFTKKFAKRIPYLDSVYDGDIARLRPAFARKIDRGKGTLTLSHYYDYKKSIKCKNGQVKSYSHAFSDTYRMLMQTAINTPKELPVSRNK